MKHILQKVYTLAPSISTFILMLLRNCQSGITRFSGKQSRDWQNSVLIKSVPMLSLTSADLEFHPWHFSHFWCISICFYHWLPSHLFCTSVIHCTYFSAFCLEMGCVPAVSLESRLNPEDIRTDAFAGWVFGLKAIQYGKLFSCVPVTALSIKVSRPHQDVVTTQEIIYNNYSEQKNSATHNAQHIAPR